MTDDELRALLLAHAHGIDRIYENDCCSCYWDGGSWADWVDHILEEAHATANDTETA